MDNSGAADWHRDYDPRVWTIDGLCANMRSLRTRARLCLAADRDRDIAPQDPAREGSWRSPSLT